VRDGVTGSVELKVIVDAGGRVERAVVVRSSGDARLDTAAVRAALAWRYEPAQSGGRPVPGEETVTVEFYRER
jgi:protein TonB